MSTGPYRRNRWPSRIDKALTHSNRKKPAKRKEYALVATTTAEYKELKREYPNMKVVLDTSGQVQEQLFDTRGLVEHE